MKMLGVRRTIPRLMFGTFIKQIETWSFIHKSAFSLAWKVNTSYIVIRHDSVHFRSSKQAYLNNCTALNNAKNISAFMVMFSPIKPHMISYMTTKIWETDRKKTINFMVYQQLRQTINYMTNNRFETSVSNYPFPHKFYTKVFKLI